MDSSSQRHDTVRKQHGTLSKSNSPARYTCVDPAILLSSLEKDIRELSKNVDQKLQEKNQLKAKLKELKKEDASKNEAIAELNSTIEILQRALSSAAPSVPPPHNDFSITISPPVTPSTSLVVLPSMESAAPSQPPQLPQPLQPSQPAVAGRSSPTNIPRKRSTSKGVAAAAIVDMSGIFAPIDTQPGEPPGSSPPSSARSPHPEDRHAYDELVSVDEVAEAMAILENKGLDNSPATPAGVAAALIQSSSALSSLISSSSSSPLVSVGSSDRTPSLPSVSSTVASLATQNSGSAIPTSSCSSQHTPQSIQQYHFELSQLQSPETASPDSSGLLPGLSPSPGSPSSPASSATLSPRPSPATLKRTIGKTIRDKIRIFEKLAEEFEAEEERNRQLRLHLQEDLHGSSSGPLRSLEDLLAELYLSEPPEDVPTGDGGQYEQPPPVDQKPPDINKTIQAPPLRKTFYGKKALLALFFEDGSQNPMGHLAANRERSHSLSMLEVMFAPKSGGAGVGHSTSTSNSAPAQPSPLAHPS